MQPVEIMQCGRLVRLVWLNGALVRLSDLQSKPVPTATSLATAATNAQEDSPRYDWFFSLCVLDAELKARRL